MKEASITTIDGDRVTVKIGDTIGFKADIEQTGIITKIERAIRRFPFQTSRTIMIHVHNEDGFPGEYLRYAKDAEIESDRIWID